MARYLDVLKPILLAALDNHREYQVPLFHWSTASSLISRVAWRRCAVPLWVWLATCSVC